MDPFLLTILCILGLGGVALCAIFTGQSLTEVRAIRKLLSAYMEHQVAAHVAEDRLAKAVQEARSMD